MTFEQARWRLQLLAELGVGTLLRDAKRTEDAAVRKSLNNLGARPITDARAHSARVHEM